MSGSSSIRQNLHCLSGSGRSLAHLIIERCVQPQGVRPSGCQEASSSHLLMVLTCQSMVTEWCPKLPGLEEHNLYSPGDMILCPAGQIVLPTWDRDTRIILVSLSAENIVKFCEEQKIPTVEMPHRPRFQNGAIFRTVQQLMACIEEIQRNTERMEALERSLLKLIIRECRSTPDGLHRLSSRRLAIIQDFVKHNLSSSISLESLAEISNYSPSRFSFLFRKTTGYSPYYYVLLQRLEKSRALLRHSDIPFSQIVSDCGFFDQSHFIRLFKRHTGLTPSQCRKQFFGKD